MVRGYSGGSANGRGDLYTLALESVCETVSELSARCDMRAYRPPRPTQHDPDERRGLQYSPTRTGVRQCKPHTSSPPPCTMSLCKAMALRRPARRQGEASEAHAHLAVADRRQSAPQRCSGDFWRVAAPVRLKLPPTAHLIPPCFASHLEETSSAFGMRSARSQRHECSPRPSLLLRTQNRPALLTLNRVV